MDSKAFYLKYRPQKISQLDSEEASQRLAAIVKSGKIPHALLFAGPRGIGKTSAARILAKAANCEKKGNEPCNRCLNCREITAGSAVDLIEIDAASNRGIDDIRDLREKIKLSPARCRFKVYIIDEVHMLTNEAFNALLKTLEEPPAHAIFILCTTQPEKLPETIISRCLRINFKKAKEKEVIRSLQRVVKGEKLKVEKGVLEAVARSVDGSFRDAHKILEQLTFKGKTIKLQEAKELLSQSEALSPLKLLGLLAEKDVKKALQEIDRLNQQGADLLVFTQSLLDALRQGLLNQLGLLTETLPQELVSLDLSQLKELIRFFSQSYVELKTSPIPQLPLELAVVEYCCPPEVEEGVKEEDGDDFHEEEKKGNGEEITLVGIVKKESKTKKSEVNKADLGNKLIKKIKGEAFKQKTSMALEKVQSKWQEILAKVKPENHSVEALLRASRPMKVEGEMIVLEVFYQFHKEQLETERCRKIVEEAATQILRQPVHLRCILGQRPVRVVRKESNFESNNSFGNSLSSVNNPDISHTGGNGERDGRIDQSLNGKALNGKENSLDEVLNKAEEIFLK